MYDPSGSESLVYTLSRDFRLRAWNPVTEVLLRTVDLRSNLTSNQDLVLRNAQTSSSSSDSLLLPDTIDVPLIQVIPHPSSTSRYSHLLVIFLATPHSSVSAGSFVVYRVTRAPNATADLVFAGSRDCSTSSVGCSIRAFTVTAPTSADHVGTGWRLAVTWEKRGLVLAETICMDDIFQFSASYDHKGSCSLSQDWQSVSSDQAIVESMDTAYFDRLISLDPPEPTDPYTNDDIAQIFLSHCFYPGRFSTIDLETALSDYSQQPERRLIPQIAAAYGSLAARFEAFVGCDLDMTIDPQTGAPVVDAYREAMKHDWLSIWARLRDLDKHSRWPLSTSIIDDQIIVFTRQGISAYVPEDVCAVVERSGRSAESNLVVEASSSSFQHVYPTLELSEVRRGAITVSTAGSYLVDRLGDTSVTEGSDTPLSSLMANLDQSLSALETEPIESRAEAVWDDYIEPHLPNEDQTALRQIISNTSSNRDALSNTLHLLENAIDEDPGMSSSRIFTGYGNALLTSTITSTVQSRYALSRSTLLVSLFVLAEIGGAGDDEESEAIVSIVDKAFAVYHRYSVLKWLCEQSGEEARIRQKSGKRFAATDDLATSQSGRGVDEVDPAYSLIHTLLVKDRTTSPQTGFNLLFDASEAYLTRLDLIDPDTPQVEPREQDVLLAFSVLVQGHADTARRLTELYPLSYGTAYVRGRAFVELGFFDDAVSLLKQASTGCKGESFFRIVESPRLINEQMAH